MNETVLIKHFSHQDIAVSSNVMDLSPSKLQVPMKSL